MSFQGNRQVNHPTNLTVMRGFRARFTGTFGGDVSSGGQVSSGGESSDWPEYPATMMDTFHNPAFNYNIHAVQNGFWSSGSTWSLDRAPVSGDIVRISDDMEVTYDRSGGEIVTVGVGYGGCLMFRTSGNTRLTADTVFVLEHGCLEMGTEAAPVQSGYTAELVIADVPPNSGYDPFQYNHGLVVMGMLETHGQPKSAGSRVRLAAEALSGNATLTTAVAVSGWLPGDRIYVPDTRQFFGDEGAPWNSGDPTYQNWDDHLTLASVTGTTLTPTSGLFYSHKSARDRSGIINIHPHVVNLSRNVRIFSANESGSRGHFMFTGHHADVDVRFTEMRNLGRTTTDLLDNTGGVYGNISHYGTNQFGRYACHAHHVHFTENDPYVYKLVGNSIWNTDRTRFPSGRKWLITVHNSHFGLIEDNVMVTGQGAGIMTETGNENGNLFSWNFIGNIRNWDRSEADGRGWGLNTGFEGVGIWQRGTLNHFIGNVAANCTKGIGWFNTSLPLPMNPPAWDAPDGTLKPDYSPYAAGAGLNADNECYGCYQAFIPWDVGSIVTTPQSGALPVIISGWKTWHISHTSFYNYRTNNFTIDGWVARGDPILTSAGQFNSAMFGGDYVQQNMLYKDCDLQNHGYGIYFTTHGKTVRVQNCTLHNYFNFYREPPYSVNTPPRFSGRAIEIIGGSCTLPGYTFAERGAPQNIKNDWTVLGSRQETNIIIDDSFLVSGWQGSGLDNFQVFYSGQQRGVFLPQTIGTLPIPSSLRGSPDSGLTNQQNFDTYGICCANELPPASGLQTRADIFGYIYPR